MKTERQIYLISLLLSLALGHSSCKGSHKGLFLTSFSREGSTVGDTDALTSAEPAVHGASPTQLLTDELLGQVRNHKVRKALLRVRDGDVVDINGPCTRHKHRYVRKGEIIVQMVAEEGNVQVIEVL